MATRNDIARADAQTLAAAAIKRGYRVFLAERGTYGIYTNKEGTRLISFQFGGLNASISGNYKTSNGHRTGTGWRIHDGIDLSRLDDYFKAYPPCWAVSDATWRFSTLEEHLQTYGESSGYTEVFACSECDTLYREGRCDCMKPITSAALEGRTP